MRFRGEREGFVYSRYGNPTLSMLEERLCLMEGAEACRVVASGMAAVSSAFFCSIKPGDHIVASRALFGSCNYIITQILPRFGVDFTLVDGRDLDAWQAAFRPQTSHVFLESPSNPTLELVEIGAVAEMSRKAGAMLIVDNIFATPILQCPLAMGADVVVYSTTKHIDGQGRSLGGAVLGKKAFIEEVFTPFYRHTGPSMSPFNAWIALKGLETLALRVEKHCDIAEEIVEALHSFPQIEQILYPSHPTHPQQALALRQMRRGGTIIAFTLQGGKEAAFAMMDRLQLIDISNNLGDTKSLITHPATTTHRNIEPAMRKAMGIGDGLVRLSVGLEDPRDLIADLQQALNSTK